MYMNNHYTGMMENYINSLSDSEIRWNEAETAALPSAIIHNKIINAAGPVYTGCNVDIERNFSEEDLCALDYDISDEYLHRCLESDYLPPRNDCCSTENEKYSTSSTEVMECIGLINTLCKLEKISVPDELHFESFPVNNLQDSNGKIPETIDYTQLEQDLFSSNEDSHKYAKIFSSFNARRQQEFMSQYLVGNVPQEQRPLMEIDNFINEMKFVAPNADTSTKHKHFTNGDESNELNIKSAICSDKMARSKKERKSRMRPTANQLLCLKKAFAKNHYLTSEMVKLLSKRLSMSEMSLKTWFANRRARFRRMNLNHRYSSNCREDSGSFATQSCSAYKRNTNSQSEVQEQHPSYTNQQLVIESFTAKKDGQENDSLVFSNDEFLELYSLLQGKQ